MCGRISGRFSGPCSALHNSTGTCLGNLSLKILHLPRTLWLLLIVGALLRLAAIELRPAGALLRAPDEPEYYEIAQNVAQGHGFAFHGAPTAYRDLLFPATAGLLIRLFGGEHAVFYFQLLLDLTTALLLFASVRRRYADRVAVMMAGAWLLYPAAILYTSLFLTETLFVFLWVLAMVVYDRLERANAVRRCIAVGFILGLLLLTRATGALLAAAILLHLLYHRRVRAALVIFAVMFVTILPWMIRNSAAVNRFALNTNSGINLYIGNNPQATGAYRFDDVVTAPLEFVRTTETERDLHATQLALNYARSHPFATLKLWPKKFAYFWSTDMALWAHYAPRADVSLAEKLRAVPLLLLILTALGYALIVLAGIAGLGLVTNTPWRGFLIFQLVLGTFSALIMYGLPRYHAPMLPALLLGAAALSTPGAWRNASRVQRIGVIGMAVLFVIVWLAESYTIFSSGSL